MEIHRSGSRTARPGPEEYFTGQVTLQKVIEAPEPARLRALTVNFQPGARTAWHTHPLGQTLIVIAGRGRVQSDGGPLREIAPGDVVWFAPGERHWHGAAPDEEMTHIALQEALDGKTADWEEQVTEADYAAPVQAD